MKAPYPTRFYDKNFIKLLFPLIILAVSIIVLVRCGTEPDISAGLHYKGTEPLILAVGDTTSNLTFSRVVVTSASGQTKTNQNYIDVELESSDTLSVKVKGLQLIALKTAQNITITASTTSGGFTSTQFKVQVVE